MQTEPATGRKENVAGQLRCREDRPPNGPGARCRLGFSPGRFRPFVTSNRIVNLQLPPGGILVGLGCDLIEVERVRGVCERQGDRFLRRVFTDEERTYCEGMKYPFKHFAARFAAKEAVSKCFTTGIGAELGWRSISIYHGPRHEPLVRLDEKAVALLQAVGGTDVVVSLSHSDTVAMAVAAIVRTPNT
jgi:holo-[acyl-carrier protein] synthase